MKKALAGLRASYVYRRSEGNHLFTVGFYDPDGCWVPESDHATAASAAARVHWLHGGSDLADRLLRYRKMLCEVRTVLEEHVGEEPSWVDGLVGELLEFDDMDE